MDDIASMQWAYLTTAATLATYLVSVIHAARSVNRRRLWNTPQARRAARFQR